MSWSEPYKNECQFLKNVSFIVLWTMNDTFYKLAGVHETHVTVTWDSLNTFITTCNFITCLPLTPSWHSSNNWDPFTTFLSITVAKHCPGSDYLRHRLFVLSSTIQRKQDGTLCKRIGMLQKNCLKSLWKLCGFIFTRERFYVGWFKFASAHCLSNDSMNIAFIFSVSNSLNFNMLVSCQC